MHVDPYAWLLTVPLTFALIHMRLLPREHAVRRVWQQMQAAEATVWWRLSSGLMDADLRPPGSFLYTTRVFCIVVAIFALASLLSFAAFVGIVPGR